MKITRHTGNFCELRGITFIKEDNSEDWKRYLFLSKFFNINQCNGTNITFMNLTINVLFFQNYKHTEYFIIFSNFI